mmetsp:Transcript_118074/g.381086  ORF Transcript_118074/g.381086 Transcript_118074/m.381086 type:complete len:209 (+) Transcript_118074:860-1486(+)
MDLSHQPFCVASLAASSFSLSTSSLMSSLIFAKGSAAMRLARAVRTLLWSRSPWMRRTVATAAPGPTSAGCRPPPRARKEEPLAACTAGCVVTLWPRACCGSSFGRLSLLATFAAGCTVTLRPGPRCRSTALPPASTSSASASRASRAAGLRARSSARRTRKPCSARRSVAAETFPPTAFLTMPMTDVSTESSSARTLERWSQVLALS